MKKTPGLTLIELLVALAILTIVSGILVSIFISGWRIFNQQSASVDTQGQAKLVTSTITREVQKATSVLEIRTFGGDSYTSSSGTLILKLPSIDSSQNIIDGSFDYKVFYLDPIDQHKLKVKTEAASGSTRRSETKTVANLIKTLTFTYKQGDTEVESENSEIIVTRVNTSKTSYNKTQEITLVSQAKLRNK